MSKPEKTRPRAAPSRADKSAERRRAIIEAALTEFSDKGFAAARMEDIAGQAAVAKGTIYLHFPDKKALFAGIVEQAMQPALETLLEERKPGEPVSGYLRRVARPLVASLAEPPRGEVIRLLIAEGPRFPDLAELYFRQIVSRAAMRITGLGAEAEAAGERSDDALERYPQLLIAPALLGVIWQALFARFEPLDLLALFDAQLALLFPDGDDFPDRRVNRV